LIIILASQLTPNLGFFIFKQLSFAQLFNTSLLRHQFHPLTVPTSYIFHLKASSSHQSFLVFFQAIFALMSLAA